jgi:hypothetical protein
MPPEPKMTLIDFLIELNKNPGWQRKFKEGGQQWQDLVERNLSPDDAALVLSGDRAAIDAKVDAEKTSAQIVWTLSIVWQ